MSASTRPSGHELRWRFHACIDAAFHALRPYIGRLDRAKILCIRRQE
ncbi:hypothetical protein BURMUCGD2M_4450 [Burkholderia multivorans CGD2M]|uniref:Uncharacterized protein n=1 Tax=Burkholderia multivorans CGD2 TaxID=513052 RepID=B9BH27_9BURK|nr:hypothetical protein BURMUCGD2_4463 [Burkholderia multivorans CGD2]EEE15008.1 hypothetical protein BURMUCGD2M_4450 [Burkholderia multivorans CGD2M]